MCRARYALIIISRSVLSRIWLKYIQYSNVNKAITAVVAGVAGPSLCCFMLLLMMWV